MIIRIVIGIIFNRRVIYRGNLGKVVINVLIMIRKMVLGVIIEDINRYV